MSRHQLPANDSEALRLVARRDRRPDARLDRAAGTRGVRLEERRRVLPHAQRLSAHGAGQHEREPAAAVAPATGLPAESVIVPPRRYVNRTTGGGGAPLAYESRPVRTTLPPLFAASRSWTLYPTLNAPATESSADRSEAVSFRPPTVAFASRSTRTTTRRGIVTSSRYAKRPRASVRLSTG